MTSYNVIAVRATRKNVAILLRPVRTATDAVSWMSASRLAFRRRIDAKWYRWHGPVRASAPKGRRRGLDRRLRPSVAYAAQGRSDQVVELNRPSCNFGGYTRGLAPLFRISLLRTLPRSIDALLTLMYYVA